MLHNSSRGLTRGIERLQGLTCSCVFGHSLVRASASANFDAINWKVGQKMASEAGSTVKRLLLQIDVQTGSWSGPDLNSDQLKAGTLSMC